MTRLEQTEKLKLKIKVSQVFRPGAPIDKYELFAGRSEQVSEVVNATLQPGRHVIIFGERGVGKTSLVKVLSEVLSQAGLTLLDSGTINCDGTDNFSSLWHKIFRELSFNMESKHVGFSQLSSSSNEKLSLERLLPDEAKPDDIRYVLNRLSKESIIIIDEVDRIKDRDTTILLADTIKTLSDHTVNTTLILVGVADSVDDLIAEHKSIERALVQVPMPRMSAEELSQIIDKGLSAAGMSMESAARQWIVFLSQGLPHYTHALGLYSSLQAIDSDRTEIQVNDVFGAIASTVRNSRTILSAYNKAISSPQKQSLYVQVLLACALAQTDDLGFFSAAAVSRPMSIIMGKKYYVTNYMRHLEEFCYEKRGAILLRTGDPRKHRFRFDNTLMRTFVILQGFANGILTEELIRIISSNSEPPASITNQT